MAAECLLTERLGLVTIAILTLSTFSGVRTVGILPRALFLRPKHFPESSVTILLWFYDCEHDHDEEC